MKGGTSPVQGEKSHDLTHFTWHMILPSMHTERPVHSSGLRETVESLGVEMSLNLNSGCGSGNWYTRTKEKTLEFSLQEQALPRAAPQSRGESGERAARWCQEHFHTHTARVPPKNR